MTLCTLDLSLRSALTERRALRWSALPGACLFMVWLGMGCQQGPSSQPGSASSTPGSASSTPAAVASPPRANSASPPTSAAAAPQLSRAATEIVGRATADLLVRAKTLATFKLDRKDFVQGNTSPDRFFGYRILARGKPLDERATRRLVVLLLAQESYSPHEKAVCASDISIGLRAEGPGGPVELNLLLPCNRVSFFRRADGDAKLTPGEYIDPIGDEVALIVRDAFPDDKALKSQP